MRAGLHPARRTWRQHNHDRHLPLPAIPSLQESFDGLPWPRLASPAPEGSRLITGPSNVPPEFAGCAALGMAGGPIRNQAIFQAVSQGCLPDWDGEVVTYGNYLTPVTDGRLRPDRTAAKVHLDLRTRGLHKQFIYYVRDCQIRSNWPLSRRLEHLKRTPLPAFCVILPTHLCPEPKEALDYCSMWNIRGFAGLDLRDPEGLYLLGRGRQKNWTRIPGEIMTEMLK